MERYQILANDDDGWLGLVVDSLCETESSPLSSAANVELKTLKNNFSRISLWFENSLSTVCLSAV